MTFLPIVSRELRLASRRRGTYWLRSAAALVMILTGTWLFLMLRTAPPKELATILFCVLSGGAVIFALLSGPRSTADSISQEKREGTLGLLFLTDLKGYDVVLGKLVAGSLNPIYCIFAVLPMMAIPLLMGGGITLAEFIRTSLVAVNALFFSLTLGICVSSMCHSPQKAAALSLLLLISFAGGLPAFGAILAEFGKAKSINLCFLVPSVGFSYYLAFDAAYKTSKFWFWLSMAIIHAASWFCLILASFVTPRSWKDKSKGENPSPWRERWFSWIGDGQVARETFRRHALDINAALWLIARTRAKTSVIWAFFALLAGVWCWGWWSFRKEWLNFGAYLGTAALVNLALRCWFAAEAAGFLAESRRIGSLELLLSTPLTVAEILQGQWLALRRQFLTPVVAALLMECVFMLATVRDALPDEDRLFWFSLWTSGMVMLIADLVALYWLGMWQGLTARNPLRAAGGSLLRVLVLPWIGYCLVLLIIILTEFTRQAYQRSPDWKFFLGLWFGLGIVTDLAFGLWARQRLVSEFRSASQHPYGYASDFWKTWFSSLKPRVSGAEPASLDPQVRA